jgi:Putative phage serine protease XkdF
MAEKKKKLKVYKLCIDPQIDDTTGVTVISLVQDPAIEKNFIAFSKEGAGVIRMKFSVDKSKMIVTGPIMIPNFPIYRNERNIDGTIKDEWYVIADKDLITNVIQKFFKTNRNANTSLEHNGALLNGVYLIESFQVDASRGIQPPVGYGSIPDGTWFGSMKVENNDIWSEIEAGTFKGFSIEGLFTYEATGATLLEQAELLNRHLDQTVRELAIDAYMKGNTKALEALTIL